MWLINVESKKLEYFTDEFQKKYAILSHTWTGGEVTFQDFQTSAAQSKDGYAKIEYTCKQAQDDGIPYAWVDTCCINKQSSAELSEAINSMFSYYREAETWYVYLSDVPRFLFQRMQSQNPINTGGNITVGYVEGFRECRWFTRGWTLQELLAPADLHFYGPDWAFIGDKQHLLGALKIITGIDQAALDDYADFDELGAFSVAQKMSWAANRNTTREEDRAYSLLGLFNVNIPLIYGERGKAFRRLQEEIIKQYSDHSLLTWHYHRKSSSQRGDLLASSPDNFAQLTKLVAFDQIDSVDHPHLDNQGLQLRARVLKCPSSSDGNQKFFAILHCRYAYDFSGPLALCLDQVGEESTDPAIFCVSDPENFTENFSTSSSGRVALIPYDEAEQAESKSIIILKHSLFASERNQASVSAIFRHFAPPQVWIRILDSRVKWCKAGDPFPQERWVGDDIFVADIGSDDLHAKEHIGCKIMLEDTFRRGAPGRSARILAIAFGMKCAERFEESPGMKADWQIRLGVGGPSRELVGGKESTAMQYGFAEALLAKSEWSHEPIIRWDGQATVQVGAERSIRMGQDLYTVTVRISYPSEP